MDFPITKEDSPAFIEEMVLQYWKLFPELTMEDVRHLVTLNYDESHIYHLYHTFNNEAP